MVIENKYNLSEVVYLITDKEQLPRIVTTIKVCPAGLIYGISSGVSETWHYEMEIAKVKDLTLLFT